MSTDIVVVNVNQTVAPTPNNLQKKGALVSQGGTTGAAGAQTLLTQASDLTAILAPAAVLSSLTWSGGTVTANTTAPHGYANGSTLWLTISGAAPAAYNGTYLCTVTTASRFTYAIVSDPGANTTPGLYQNTSAVELLAAVTTFFAQGSGQGVYVNELGYGSPAAGVTALNTWIAANPSVYYSYLVPRSWAGESTFLTFLAQFEALTSKTFFFVTMTNTNRNSFTAAMNCVFGLIEAPSVPATEMSVAAPFYVTLNYAPNATSKVTMLGNAYVYGVTPYPTAGNSALFTAWKAAGVNWIGQGSEGGISNTLVKNGRTMDVRPFNYWYDVDWVQINLATDIAAAVINGSNNPQNPLYNNQAGINRLQTVAAATLNRGVSYGTVFGRVVQTALTQDAFNQAFDSGDLNGQAVVNAVPFADYYAANPSDYRNEVYGGFGVVMAPQLGFDQIIFYVQVTDFVA